MTKGQMAPTTLLDQKTSTTPEGRDADLHGYPLRVCELLSTLDGSAYLARVAVNTPAHVRRARRAIRRALEVQMAGLGFSLVEVLSSCPAGWGMNPQKAAEWVEEGMAKYYRLGEIKVPEA